MTLAYILCQPALSFLAQLNVQGNEEGDHRRRRLVGEIRDREFNEMQDGIVLRL